MKFNPLIWKVTVLLGMSSVLIATFQNCGGKGMQVLEPDGALDSGSIGGANSSATGAVASKESFFEFEITVNQTLEKVIDSAGVINPSFEIQSRPKLGSIKNFNKQSGLFIYQPSSDVVGIDEFAVVLTGQDGQTRTIRLKIYVNATDQISFSLEKINDGGQVIAGGTVFSGDCTKVRLTRRGPLRELQKTAQVDFDRSATKGRIFSDPSACNQGGLERNDGLQSLEFTANSNVKEFFFRTNDFGVQNAKFRYGSIDFVQSFTVKISKHSIVQMSIEGPTEVIRTQCSGPFKVAYVDKYQNRVLGSDLAASELSYRLVKDGLHDVYNDSSCYDKVNPIQNYTYPNPNGVFYLKSRGNGEQSLNVLGGTLLPANLVQAQLVINTTSTVPLTPKIEACGFFSELFLSLSVPTSHFRYYVIQGSVTTADDCSSSIEPIATIGSAVALVRNLTWDLKNEHRIVTVVVCPVENSITIAPKLLIDLRFPLIVSGGFDLQSFECKAVP